MDKSRSTPGPDEGIDTVAAHFAQHVALLENPGNLRPVATKADLLDEGAAVFGLACAKVEPLALCLQVRKITPAEAVNWLAERKVVPLLYVPIQAVDFDAHWSL